MRLSALDTKVLRDVVRLRGQLGAIVLVIACGVGVYIGMSATMRALRQARASYYAAERFGHVFASLERAPEGVRAALAAIPGVQAVQTRVVADVTLDVPDMVEAATGRLLSIPDHGRPLVNDLRLVSGRLPELGKQREVLASQAFVEAHGFQPGARVGAVLDGKRVELEIVGVALSPEYTYSLAPGLLFPDDRRFGVFWMRRDGLASAFDLDGAFNDVSLRLARDALPRAVIWQVDRDLARYGGLGAYARKDQQSAFFLENELAQLQTFAFVVPALFLAVAAFLLNLVFERLVASQRGDIAALKAFGYHDREVGLHYAKLVGVVLVVGWLVGLALAGWMGSSLTRLYGDYYRFPALDFRLGLADPLVSLAVGTLAAGIGAWAAIRRTVRLPPAEAMRPAAPAVYEPTFVERLGLADFLPTAVRMVLRELERKPLRALFSVAGVALATALTVVMAFTADSVRHVLNVQFELSQREDVQLTLAQPRALGVLSGLEALPGVLHAEAYRTVPVELAAGHRTKRAAITGLPPGSALVGLLDEDLRPVPLPADGLLLSRKLAELLGAGAGDTLRVAVLEGQRRGRSVRVARVVETFVGIAAYMRLAPLCRLLGETETLNGARLLVDDARLGELHAAVKQTPVIAGVTARDAVLRQVRRMLDENLGLIVTFSLAFALVMAFGVLYNTARITLAERARELATLRVLGFRRSEVAAILIGEMALLLGLAIPLGLVAGYGLASALVHSPGYDTEQFRLPLVIYPATYATAVLAVLAAGLASGWSAWRSLDRFDIVEVLKTRD